MIRQPRHEAVEGLQSADGEGCQEQCVGVSVHISLTKSLTLTIPVVQGLFILVRGFEAFINLGTRKGEGVVGTGRELSVKAWPYS